MRLESVREDSFGGRSDPRRRSPSVPVLRAARFPFLLLICVIMKVTKSFLNELLACSHLTRVFPVLKFGRVAFKDTV